MIRVGIQLFFCSIEKIRRQTVVERNNHNIITRLFSLDDRTVESSQTLIVF